MFFAYVDVNRGLALQFGFFYELHITSNEGKLMLLQLYIHVHTTSTKNLL